MLPAQLINFLARQPHSLRHWWGREPERGGASWSCTNARVLFFYWQNSSFVILPIQNLVLVTETAAPLSPCKISLNTTSPENSFVPLFQPSLNFVPAGNFQISFTEIAAPIAARLARSDSP